MALTFSCPACKSVLRVSDEMAGKKARCPSCQTVFTLPQESEAAAPLPAPAPPPVKPAPAPKSAAPPISLTPDDDDEEPTPRSKKPPPLAEKPTRKRPRDEDEDDEKDEPRPPRRRPVVDNDDDEEVDDEDDRPRRRRRKKPASSNTGLWVLGGIGAVVVLLLVCGGGILLIFGMGGGGQKIALNNGQFHVDDSLGITDSFDKRMRNSRCKRYQIDMVQGRTYQIDMLSQLPVDAFLRLEDSAGTEVALDDDSGGFPNARIIYVAPRTGAYTIIACTFNGSLGAYNLTVRETQGGGGGFKK